MGGGGGGVDASHNLPSLFSIKYLCCLLFHLWSTFDDKQSYIPPHRKLTLHTHRWILVWDVHFGRIKWFDWLTYNTQYWPPLCTYVSVFVCLGRGMSAVISVCQYGHTVSDHKGTPLYSLPTKLAIVSKHYQNGCYWQP